MKNGWVTKKLGEIGTCKNGLNFKRAAVGKAVDIVGVGDFKKGLVVDGTTDLERLTLQELPEQEWYLQPNDIVFVRSNGSKALVGRAVIIKTKRPLTFSGFCIRYRIEDKCVDPDYLVRMVSAENFRRAMLVGRNASTINNVTQSILLSQVIRFPPLAEQKQIVAKIDAAFEKIDKLKANAEKNLANAKELFQSALDEAMRPKKGWVEKRLGEIGSCKNGLNFKRAAEGEKIDIVGVSDFKKGLVVDDATELERLTLQELPEQEWYLHPNDIVFVRSNGSKALVGRAVIIKSKRPLTFSGFCIRYRIEDKRIDPDYLARIVSVESFRKAMLSGRNATTINNVTQPILLSQVISIPSLGEQKQIIKHLDFLSEKIKMLEQNYARQIADCAEMRQAILREAFEGRL